MTDWQKELAEHIRVSELLPQDEHLTDAALSAADALLSEYEQLPSKDLKAEIKRRIVAIAAKVGTHLIAIETVNVKSWRYCVRIGNGLAGFAALKAAAADDPVLRHYWVSHRKAKRGRRNRKVNRT